MGANECLYALVRGRVQGVGFRAATLREACLLSLTGWVRNTPDLAVEVSAEGRPEQLRAFEDFLRHGPRGAHVTGFDVHRQPAKGEFPTFAIR